VQHSQDQLAPAFFVKQHEDQCHEPQDSVLYQFDFMFNSSLFIANKLLRCADALLSHVLSAVYAFVEYCCTGSGAVADGATVFCFVSYDGCVRIIQESPHVVIPFPVTTARANHAAN
jgi:hypothetical protein